MWIESPIAVIPDCRIYAIQQRLAFRQSVLGQSDLCEAVEISVRVLPFRRQRGQGTLEVVHSTVEIAYGAIEISEIPETCAERPCGAALLCDLNGTLADLERSIVIGRQNRNREPGIERQGFNP